MNKKDYELIAKTLLQAYNNGASDTELRAIALEFAKEFADKNVKFNRSKFLQACGLEV